MEQKGGKSKPIFDTFPPSLTIASLPSLSVTLYLHIYRTLSIYVTFSIYLTFYL